jgi:hypothetical protein
MGASAVADGDGPDRAIFNKLTEKSMITMKIQ